MPSKKGIPIAGNPNNTRDYITRPVWGCEQKDSTGRADAPKRKIHTWNRKTYRVHQLVCEAFHGPRPSPSHIVLHLNEEASDNRPENLRWGTRKENQNFPKVKAAFRARTGAKSPISIYLARVAQDPNYKSNRKKDKP